MMRGFRIYSGASGFDKRDETKRMKEKKELFLHLSINFALRAFNKV